MMVGSKTSNPGPIDVFLESSRERRQQIQRSNRLFALAAAATTSKDNVISSIRVMVVDDDWVIRSLYPTEIETLRGPCQCRSADWSQICLMVRKRQQTVPQCHLLEQLVFDNYFRNIVVLGIDPETTSTTVPSPSFHTNDDDDDSLLENHRMLYLLPVGVKWNDVISNCILEVGTRVYKNSILSQTHLHSNAAIIHCGMVTSQRNTQLYQNEKQDIMITVTVGAESGGGRQLRLVPESTMVDVCQQLDTSQQKKTNALPITLLSSTTALSNDTNQETEQLNKDDSSCICQHNLISSHCVIRDTPTIQNVVLGPHASIVAATWVSQALLFPRTCIGNACTVRNVILQWDSTIVDHSTLSNTLLMEQAHAGPNSLVVSSVLGPDVHVSAGEVHTSVLGPNTNAHHQSLLIGMLWPLGRGNVGYGANVGSNHTGRIPDQETCAGEGTFWGLSCVIKFPVDLSYSPYSIVAAGTQLPPQRIAMPFSLIVSGGGDGGGDGNSILPGWVLQSSPYTLLRSEQKFATRRKALRHFYYTGWNVLRPDIIDLCRAAREALKNITTTSVNNDAVVDKNNHATASLMIGLNFLSERARHNGIQAYTECIQRYALHGFLNWIEEQLLLFEDNHQHHVSQILEHEFDVAGLSTTTSSTYDNGQTHPLATLLTVVSWPVLPWESKYGIQNGNQNNTKTHPLMVLREEFPIPSGNNNEVMSWAIRLLNVLIQKEDDYAKNVYKCKQRDDVRGCHTIPGYGDFHVAADKDPVIVNAREAAILLEQRIRKILDVLASTQRSRL